MTDPTHPTLRRRTNEPLDGAQASTRQETAVGDAESSSTAPADATSSSPSSEPSTPSSPSSPSSSHHQPHYGAPLRPTLSRSTTNDSPTASFELSDDEPIFSGLPLLDLFVLVDAHLELWTRGIRRKSADWRSKADKLVEESKARAQRIKLPRVASETFLNGMRSEESNGVLSSRDRERLEKRVREVRANAKEQMRRLNQKWEQELSGYVTRAYLSTTEFRSRRGGQFADPLHGLSHQISFFSGVMNVLISALLLGFEPTWIPAWYSAQVMAYLPLRVYTYKKRSYHYFLFDLCYAINGLCLVYLWILPGNVFLFQACYGLALGSLGTAIATWRNSLVFHSLDKVISLAIHIFPPFVFTTIRHFYPNAEARYPALVHLPDLQSWSARWKSMAVCMFTYLIWQALYFQYIIVARKEKIKQGRATSFTFLINDRKRLIGKIAAKVRPERREAAFIFGQAVYTLVTLLIPIFGLYDSKFWSSVYLLTLFAVSVWNGASFYMEVFARKFEKELIALRREFEAQQEILSKTSSGILGAGSVDMSRSASQADLPTTVAEVDDEVDEREKVDGAEMDGEASGVVVEVEGVAGQDLVMVDKEATAAHEAADRGATSVPDWCDQGLLPEKVRASSQPDLNRPQVQVSSTLTGFNSSPTPAPPHLLVMAARVVLSQTLARVAPASTRTLAPRWSAARSFCSSSSSRAEATSTAASSTPPPPPSNLSPKISQIVDQISTLTLLEAADLVDALKTRLNITDVAMPTMSAPSASAAAAPVVEEAAAAAPKEKTVFNVTLKAIDAAQKAKAIREVKALMPNMNLVEAKKFVESLPKVLKENATKEEGEKLQALFKAIGAEATLE
ncbi:BZ3500_MvSof-1268-A1-R1_Chr2-1g04484 [Microbotryum saponariae]|uniref:Glycerophosphocholine acyltransferase 1 n=1 Tax=Microbotryum saponariae TaxID=289078 RepID=A0A2X0KZI7_9BASI|nr:BZ3500_MvSof-1268-A1-R1_Chr2-1g04484 [Microbotryum saponariae]SCZ91811.1 BZ3501_MvSof-1269-A2-R1_Chr2-1g04140 [Microbotryum saponariae]